MSGSVRSGCQPHSRRESTDSYASSTGSANRATRPPRIEMAATSPLSKIGIKGDGLMLFITCFASIGVFLFGYDQGVMSGIITGPHFRAFFREPTAYEIGTMVAILEIGAFITSLACGTLADIFGRKNVLFWGAILFSIGGAVQTCTTGFTSMVIGRVIAGFGVGTLSMIVPTYQSEISPAENRGMLACIEFTGNIAGYAASVWIDYFCSYIPSDLSWRLPLSIQVLIGLTLAFGSLLLPESPRWLLDHDQDEEGMRVLADLHGGGNPREPRARLEYREIKENVLTLRKEPDRSYTAMWRRYRYRTFIACSSQMFAQLNGINVISYYAPLVFESAGWLGRDALLMTGINGIIYILSTVPTWFLVDTWGRRPILLSGAVIMAISLALCGYFLYLDTTFTAKAVVGCVIVFNAAFGFSWGPIPWLLPAEIMPLAFRAKGASLSTATNWAFNFIIGEGTPILQEKIKWRLYPMHAFFCTCSFILVFFVYPETMGVPLEEMDQLFGDEPSGVPQGDDTDDEDETDEEARLPPSSSRPRTIRTSISSHPRFMSPEERAARAAAARVAAEERAARDGVLGAPKRWLGRVLGANAREPDRRLYQMCGAMSIRNSAPLPSHSLASVPQHHHQQEKAAARKNRRRRSERRLRRLMGTNGVRPWPRLRERRTTCRPTTSPHPPAHPTAPSPAAQTRNSNSSDWASSRMTTRRSKTGAPMEEESCGDMMMIVMTMIWNGRVGLDERGHGSACMPLLRTGRVVVARLCRSCHFPPFSTQILQQGYLLATCKLQVFLPPSFPRFLLLRFFLASPFRTCNTEISADTASLKTKGVSADASRRRGRVSKRRTKGLGFIAFWAVWTPTRSHDCLDVSSS